MVASIIVASVLAVAFIALRVTVAPKSTNGGVFTMFMKALASIGFIGVGVAAIFTGVDNASAAIFMILGLVFGLIGDMVLDLKVVYLKQPEEGIYLTGGMASFALGHIMYFVAVCVLLKGTVTMALVGVCVAIAAVLAFCLVFGGEKFLKFNFGKFTIHSVIYAFILVFMSAISIGLLIVMKSSRMVLFMVGMILFLLSDLVLTQMYFGGRPKDKALCVINHALYYAAQIVLASFIFTM